MLYTNIMDSDELQNQYTDELIREDIRRELEEEAQAAQQVAAMSASMQQADTKDGKPKDPKEALKSAAEVGTALSNPVSFLSFLFKNKTTRNLMIILILFILLFFIYVVTAAAKSANVEPGRAIDLYCSVKGGKEGGECFKQMYADVGKNVNGKSGSQSNPKPTK